MTALLARPYRPVHTGLAVWRLALLFGLFVFLFLFLFEPFGLNGLDRPLWKLALGYGCTCAAVMVIMNGLVPRLFPGFFQEERWTVGREIGWSLANVAAIGAANVAYSVAIGIARPSWSLFWWFEAYTLLIGSFPVAVVVLFSEARLSRKYRSGSERVNAGLRAEVPDPRPAAGVVSPASPAITIPSENGREDMVLDAADLLFIRSAANYMEVHHRVAGAPVRRVVRGSLKRAEEVLGVHPRIIRCHKRHIVNLDRVVRVSGNAQGYRLHLGDGVEPVPVSRQLNDRLAGLLAGRP